MLYSKYENEKCNIESQTGATIIHNWPVVSGVTIDIRCSTISIIESGVTVSLGHLRHALHYKDSQFYFPHSPGVGICTR